MPRQSPSNGRTYLERVVGDLNRMKQIPMRCTNDVKSARPLIIMIETFVSHLEVCSLEDLTYLVIYQELIPASGQGFWKLTTPSFSRLSLIKHSTNITYFHLSFNRHSHILGYFCWKFDILTIDVWFK